MAKKSQRSSKKRSKKWSRANIMNFVLGGIVALSMVLGSLFVFGGASPSSQAPAPTVVTVPTTAPVVSQGVTLTPTPVPASPTPAPAGPTP